MAEVKKTSVEWKSMPPYDGLALDNADGWVSIMVDSKGVKREVRDLFKTYNTELITEDEFRERLKKSNCPPPTQKVADLEKAKS